MTYVEKALKRTRMILIARGRNPEQVDRALAKLFVLPIKNK
jgi:hypothetical protein